MAKNFTCNVVTAWNGSPDPFDFDFPKIPKEHSWFYVFMLRDWENRNYLKIGTANDLFKRLKKPDYQNNYKSIRVLALLEFDNQVGEYQVEDMTRSELRKMPGVTWVPTDRFTFNRLPERIPIYDGPMHLMGMLNLCECVDNPTKKCYTYSVERS